MRWLHSRRASPGPPGHSVNRVCSSAPKCPTLSARRSVCWMWPPRSMPPKASRMATSATSACVRIRVQAKRRVRRPPLGRVPLSRPSLTGSNDSASTRCCGSVECNPCVALRDTRDRSSSGRQPHWAICPGQSQPIKPGVGVPRLYSVPRIGYAGGVGVGSSPQKPVSKASTAA